MTKDEINKLQYRIIGAAIEVHKQLGVGLLESVYHRCMEEEFDRLGIRYRSELRVNVDYKGVQLDTELRSDFLVEDMIVVELKAVEKLHPVFDAQLLTYMKLLRKPKGILINFFCDNINASGKKVLVNEYFSALP